MTQQTKNYRIDDDAMEEICEAFSLYDTKNTGSVDILHLKSLFHALNVPSIKKGEIKAMLHTIDKFDNETTVSVTRDEFIEIVSPKIHARDPDVELNRMFNLFDEDGSGCITFQNLKGIAVDCAGVTYSDTDLQEMLDVADQDGDGVLNREEFCRIMRQRNAKPLDLLSSDEEEEKDDNDEKDE